MGNIDDLILIDIKKEIVKNNEEQNKLLKAILAELKKITALPKYKFEEEDEVSGLGALFG
jgi:bacterioferritin (cytochrome b1)